MFKKVPQMNCIPKQHSESESVLQSPLPWEFKKEMLPASQSCEMGRVTLSLRLCIRRPVKAPQRKTSFLTRATTSSCLRLGSEWRTSQSPSWTMTFPKLKSPFISFFSTPQVWYYLFTSMFIVTWVYLNDRNSVWSLNLSTWFWNRPYCVVTCCHHCHSDYVECSTLPTLEVQYTIVKTHGNL